MTTLDEYKKYRFMSQRDTYSCGAVAIINLYKWAGYSFSRKDLKYFRAILGTVRPNLIKGLTGTWSHTIDEHLKKSKLIRYGGYKYVSGKNADIYKLDKHLDNGGCCLINIYWDKNGGGHYFVIIGHTENKYITVNYATHSDTVFMVSKKEIKKYMKNDVSDAEGWHPSCIFWINKNE